MADEVERWMPRERWDGLVRGDGCPMCADLAAEKAVDQYGSTIVELRITRLRLAANQSIPGYCVLICHRHVREPYHLSKEEQGAFFDDLMRSAAAIDRALGPAKMNVSILGNAIPHLHAHLKPRLYGDRAPGRQISSCEPPLRLTDEESARRVELIRAALQVIASEG